MSLIRTGIVVACGVALLPADKASQEHVFAQAAEAAGWAATYCTREPAKCEQAAVLWENFKDKAAFAGKLALDASQKYAAGAAPQTEADTLVRVAVYDPGPAPVEVPVRVRDTLLASDLRPAWRGPVRK